MALKEWAYHVHHAVNGQLARLSVSPTESQQKHFFCF
uniref:Uncharacterized protein n=1 Tax=Anguilla anguilla TaxID=7936 RepID=A0A0E9VHC9_ANGAN